jgi:DeoR/GlpR family transcriptional regulator of sugar metabolism
LQAEERQNRIEQFLQEVEFASLDEISDLVDASTSTVRRDLQILESKGSVQRTHGGARLANPRSDEFMFSKRDTLQLTEKEALGKACAGLVLPGQTVIMDAGTTVYHVARHLESANTQVITNSLPVANYFAGNNRFEVVLSGGVMYPRLGVLVGPLAVETFSKLHADVAIMGAGGITVEGVTNSHGLLIEIQRAMMRAAQKVIFCLDHTKFGRRSVSFLCELNAIDRVVTDAAAPEELVARLREKGLEVHVAEPGNTSPANGAPESGGV